MNTIPFEQAIYRASSDHFHQCINSLINQFDKEKKIVRISFLGNASDEDYELKRRETEQIIAKVFDTSAPLISFIAQPALTNDTVIAEVVYLNTSGSNYTIYFKNATDTPYILIENETVKLLLLEGIRSDDLTKPIATQGSEIFTTIRNIFEREGFQAHDIVRQWNYIGGITEASDGIQHYQAFNEARAGFYATGKWQGKGYPAATGIGMSVRGLLVSLVAVISKSEELRIIPINNPLQIAAHQYSQTQLIGEVRKVIADPCVENGVTTATKVVETTHRLATPKFERAKIILYKQSGIGYISGTAAIRGEESMHSMNAAMQTRQTIENIQFLMSEKNLNLHGISQFVTTFVSLRVYFKNAEDADVIKAEVEKQWAGIPVVYTQADVCRKELLVEIEGVARLKL